MTTAAPVSPSRPAARRRPRDPGAARRPPRRHRARRRPAHGLRRRLADRVVPEDRPRAPATASPGRTRLALQIRQGAPADVFASAAPNFTQELFRDGLVEKPRFLAFNRLALIVPKSNPAGIKSVYDLNRDGIKLVVAGPRVPVGSYTRTVLRNLGTLERPAERRQQRAGRQGRARQGRPRARRDAGFVYVTDARAAASRLTTITIPVFAQPKVRYEIAVVASSPDKAAARAFVARATGRAGRRLHGAGYGFRFPPPEAQAGRPPVSTALPRARGAGRWGEAAALHARPGPRHAAGAGLPRHPDPRALPADPDRRARRPARQADRGRRPGGHGQDQRHRLRADAARRARRPRTCSARRRFPGRSLVITAIELPLVLPPAVAGIGLLAAFGRLGLLGETVRRARDLDRLHPDRGRPRDPVRRRALLPAPGDRDLRGLDDDLILAARTLGAGPAGRSGASRCRWPRAASARGRPSRWRAASASSARRSCSRAASRGSPRP